MIGAHQSTRTYIKCTAWDSGATFEKRNLFGVKKERRVNMCTGINMVEAPTAQLRILTVPTS